MSVTSYRRPRDVETMSRNYWESCEAVAYEVANISKENNEAKVLSHVKVFVREETKHTVQYRQVVL